jgi:hypothetical protein
MGLRKFLSQAGQYCGIRFFFFLFAHVYTAFDFRFLILFFSRISAAMSFRSWCGSFPKPASSQNTLLPGCETARSSGGERLLP